MSLPDNPYDAPIEQQRLEFPLHVKVIAAALGAIVVVGTAATLGAFLFGLLILIAGRSQPTPLTTVQWLESPLQKFIFGVGSIFIAVISFLLGSWSVRRIFKSQRLTAEVLYRQRKLKETVGQMHSAVMEQRVASKSHDAAVRDLDVIPHDS